MTDSTTGDGAPDPWEPEDPDELPDAPALHLMPGEEHRFSVSVPPGAAPLVIRLDFRDAAGLRWRTTSRGQLTGPL